MREAGCEGKAEVCALGAGRGGSMCVAGEGVFVCQCIALPQWQRNYLAETFTNGKKVVK